MSQKSNGWKSRINGANIKREAINTAYVAAGLVGATVLDRLIEKGAERFLPSVAPYLKYIKPIVITATGLATSVLTAKPDGPLKFIGYGVSSAGALSAVRLIPGIDTLLSGIAFTGIEYTERLLNHDVSGLEKLGETVQHTLTENAPAVVIELPALEGSRPSEQRAARIEPKQEYSEEITEEIGFVDII